MPAPPLPAAAGPAVPAAAGSMEHRTGYRRLDGTSSRPGGEAGEADGTGVTGEELGGAKEGQGEELGGAEEGQGEKGSGAWTNCWRCSKGPAVLADE